MHFRFRLPINSWSPIRAKTVRANSVRIITSFKALQDSINAETMVFKPGITEMAFKARKTRKARRAAIPGIWLVFSLGVDWSPSLLFTTDPNVSIRISRYLKTPYRKNLTIPLTTNWSFTQAARLRSLILIGFKNTFRSSIMYTQFWTLDWKFPGWKLDCLAFDWPDDPMDETVFLAP